MRMTFNKTWSAPTQLEYKQTAVSFSCVTSLLLWLQVIILAFYQFSLKIITVFGKLRTTLLNNPNTKWGENFIFLHSFFFQNLKIRSSTRYKCKSHLAITIYLTLPIELGPLILLFVQCITLLNTQYLTSNRHTTFEHKTALFRKR